MGVRMNCVGVKIRSVGVRVRCVYVCVLTGIGLEMVLRVMRDCPGTPPRYYTTILPSTAEGERRKAAGNTKPSPACVLLSFLPRKFSLEI